jgi:N-acetylglucosaminyldiphosphoundecaprenol N-acetyl-beta-D-mannosaminyltransferase
MKKIEYIDFFGLKLSIFNIPELLEYIKGIIEEGNKAVCYGYSFGTMPYFKKYPEIAIYANQFEVSVVDGRGLYLLAKLLRAPVKSDLSIPSLVDYLLKIADENKYSLMLLGAQDQINKKASENLKLKFPNARILPGMHGYFNENEETEIIKKINLLKPDILLIGISSPKKERLAFQYKDQLDASIIIPCGGVIDILAGHKKRIPRFVKKIGMAWFYRFIQEPKRLFRDSILNSFNVGFLMIPSLLFQTYILHKKFSIPKFYHKLCNAPIS